MLARCEARRTKERKFLFFFWEVLAYNAFLSALPLDLSMQGFMGVEYESWGRYPKAQHTTLPFSSRFDKLPVLKKDELVLAFGRGRSYGDACLNAGQFLIPMQSNDRFMEFDYVQGVLRCEAGTTLDEILKLIVPQGWFLPVTPGTQFVTVGGAIANDIHGKNHHCDGNFGHHLVQFELLRSDGQRLLCSPSENREFFHATIGGLGLTGLITWAEFRLKKIQNPFVTQESIRFYNLKEFFQLSRESEKDFTYTVSWVDCMAKGASLGRGLFIRGNHASSQILEARSFKMGFGKIVPVEFPGWALNSLSVKLFNSLYFRKQLSDFERSIVPYTPFFYPLDSIQHWNRIYGKRGLLQWQCVVPFQQGEDAIAEILRRIAQSGFASFLAVLKTFGNIPANGMLSFPRPGVTLALDFPMVGERLLKLLDELDALVRGAEGGAIYPAKDARMTEESFKTFFPRWKEFLAYKDPQFSSSLWRRLVP